MVGLDPRISPPLSVNERLLDRAVRHAIHLERYKAGEVRKALRFLDEKVYPDLIGRLTTRLERVKARGFDRGPQTTQRLRDMVAALDAILDRQLGALYRKQRSGLVDLADVEARWQVAALESAMPAVQFETLLPSAATLRSVVVSRPFQGKLLRDWWGQHSRATKGRIRDAIAIGIAEGEGTAAIVRRVRGSLAISRRGAEAIVRTAVNHVSSHSRQATYQENGALLKGWQFVATLDSRTTPVCQALDGKTFAVESGPHPPRHIGCRSTSTPLVKSWRELGFDLDDAPPGTRASMNGQVPAELSYGDWLRRQDREAQVEALGATRARLFRSGKVAVDRFVDQAGRTLTLDELRERVPAAFE